MTLGHNEYAKYKFVLTKDNGNVEISENMVIMNFQAHFLGAF